MLFYKKINFMKIIRIVKTRLFGLTLAFCTLNECNHSPISRSILSPGVLCTVVLQPHKADKSYR